MGDFRAVAEVWDDGVDNNLLRSLISRWLYIENPEAYQWILLAAEQYLVVNATLSF